MKPLRAVPGHGTVGAPRELCVLVRCGELAVAIATRWVDRLIPQRELPVIPGSAPVSGGGSSGRLGLVDLDGARLVAWDLAMMIGVAVPSEAWVILRGITAPSETEPVPIALRVGRCVKVTPLPELVPIPPGLFRARHAAWVGVARGAELSPEAEDVIGLALDPSRLWTGTELAASRRVAQEAGRGRV